MVDMKIIQQLNSDTAIFEVPKICNKCHSDIYTPYTENLFKIIENDKLIDVCKDCCKKNKEMKVT